MDLINFATYSHGIPDEEQYGFAQAIRVGNTIHIAGQLAQDENGTLLHADDFESQLKIVWMKADKILSHFGANRNHIVQETIFMVGMRENLPKLVPAHQEYYGDHRPTSTAVGVTELALPGQVIEISFVADLRLPD